MNIKEAADRLGISSRAIRFYEEKGLLRPAKQPENGYRIYTENDIWRLQTISALREIGMSIQDIAQALAEIDRGNPQKLEEYLELQQAVMYAQWVELKRMLDTTQRMIDINRSEGPLNISHLHDLAQSARRLREARQNWHDHWNYDKQAAIHDQRVQGKGNPAPHAPSKDTHDGEASSVTSTALSAVPPMRSGEEESAALVTHRTNRKPSTFSLYAQYDQALEQNTRWMNPAPGEKGLDIGTGTGNLAGKLLELGADMTGIDQSREMLRTCRTKYPGMQVRLGNFLALPFADQSFDFLVSSFAFHHLSADQQQLALQEMRRVLTARGRIGLTDLMYVDEAYRERYIRAAEAAGDEAMLTAVRERHFPLLDELCRWLEHREYVTKTVRHNDLLHTLLAVPLR